MLSSPRTLRTLPKRTRGRPANVDALASRQQGFGCLEKGVRGVEEGVWGVGCREAYFSSGLGVALSCPSTRRFCSAMVNARGGSSPADQRGYPLVAGWVAIPQLPQRPPRVFGAGTAVGRGEDGKWLEGMLTTETHCLALCLVESGAAIQGRIPKNVVPLGARHGAGRHAAHRGCHRAPAFRGAEEHSGSMARLGWGSRL